ncbi:universal stress protein [Agromyces endophyticus]|uniref:universal stress protein n=1 Tax=Agromyces sp. H17E-10 TaxID=2932244 RepID=UPI001FD4BFC8|nr:universal stress protein [Agromyces sp. H17E-10]UOQ89961.1 universal stress protein [Agromyces sp. H17E-10]
MSEIVVGVSTAGQAGLRAVRWGAERASAQRARLRLVHVVDSAVEATGDAELLLAALDRARASLADAAGVALDVDPALEVETDLEQGSPVDVFAARSRGAGLLVVGSDWHGGKRPSRRGVHSLRIAAASEAPVAVVPDIDVSARRGVVVGVDGSEPGGRALAFAADEAEGRGVPLVAVHAWDMALMAGGEYGYGPAMVAVDDLSDAARTVLDDVLDPIVAERPELEIERRIEAGDPVTALSEAAASAELLVVGSHGRGAIARFLLGSVSHGVLSRLEAPTVVVR